MVLAAVPGPGRRRIGPVRSPGLADDLSGLPPALLVLPECDPLRDEGRAYAQRLRRAGVPAEVRIQPGTFHGFLGAAGVLPEAEEALEGAGRWLRGV
ncbi:alpha/beta hydrolase fold domain-containing protein [Streptomyces sp. H27-D2]|nr:alpha/beta hydrolase fold domain-containing protein [Streptomyces sp. H27-D2]MEC4016362.1 alpha/beta hydrolase fold domain-containing protein [Streptomyces sp. H27-D2]